MSKKSKKYRKKISSTTTYIDEDTKSDKNNKIVKENLKITKLTMLIKLQELSRCHSTESHHGATKSQSFRMDKQPMKGFPSNKIKVLLD